jgi:hypothetical protein
MALFKKKEQKDAEPTPIDKISVQTKKIEEKEPTIDQIIITNTEVWYKTQIFAAIIEIIERQKKIEERSDLDYKL